MPSINHIAGDYAARFPEISPEDHRAIVMGALGGRTPVMTEDGFRRGYDIVARGLDKAPDLLGYIRENPHAALHREAMIGGGDWMATSIETYLRDRRIID